MMARSTNALGVGLKTEQPDRCCLGLEVVTFLPTGNPRGVIRGRTMKSTLRDQGQLIPQPNEDRRSYGAMPPF
jgi:hypothetical protein